MSGRRRHRRTSPPQGPAAAGHDRLDRVLRELETGRTPAAPDVAGAVMERLGYRPLSRRQALASHLSRFARRAGGVLSVVILVGVGLFAVDSMRREQGKARRVDDVMRASIRERGAWLDEVVEGLRPVSDIPSALRLPSPLPSTLPGREFERHSVPAVEHEPDPTEPPAAPAVAPFRQA